MERKFIECNIELCTGCQICESACAAGKKGTRKAGLSRMHLVRIDEEKAITVACRFCVDMPCIKACPRNALKMDEKANVIRLDKMRCAGCGWCIEACRFSAIVLDQSTKSVVICDMCEGRERPRCVQSCPKKALGVARVQIKA
jgi:carbon-monoxide dehydrogenase iron sulfur subunit